jgi:hypothetical protein
MNPWRYVVVEVGGERFTVRPQGIGHTIGGVSYYSCWFVCRCGNWWSFDRGLT